MTNVARIVVWIAFVLASMLPMPGALRAADKVDGHDATKTEALKEASPAAVIVPAAGRFGVFFAPPPEASPRAASSEPSSSPSPSTRPGAGRGHGHSDAGSTAAAQAGERSGAASQLPAQSPSTPGTGTGTAGAAVAASGPPVAAGNSSSTPSTPSTPTAANTDQDKRANAGGADAAIPTAEIAPRADSISATLRNVDDELRDLSSVDGLRDEVGHLARDADRLQVRTDLLLRGTPTLDWLRELDVKWADVERRSNGTVRDFTRRLGALDRIVQDIDRIARQWQITLVGARQESAPDETIGRVDRVLSMINDERMRATAARADLLALQSRAGDASNVAGDMRARIQRGQDTAINRLFSVDREPLWTTGFALWSDRNLLKASGESMTSRVHELYAYLRERAGVVALFALLFASLSALLYRARRRLREQQQEDVQLVGAAIAVERPVAIAALLTLVTAALSMRAVPSLLNVVLLTLAALPTALVLGRSLLPAMRPVVTSLIGLFMLNQIRGLTEGMQAQAAIGFLFECMLLMAVTGWIVRRNGFMPLVSAPHRVQAQFVVQSLSRAGALVGLLGIVFYVAGLSALADLIVNAYLVISYSSMLLYAISRIGEGLLAVLLRSWPFTLLATVRNHRPVLVERGNRLLHWGLIGAGVWIALEATSLRRPAFHLVDEILSAEAGNASYRLSLGGVLAFVFTVLAAWFASRTIKFLLQEEIYPRVDLPRGVPYAVSSIVHYVLMFFGVLTAVSAMGVDLTRFTVLSGAFGVGLGLGLQGIVNNFVSGLFLLFERPLKIGDVVQLDDLNGRVDRIGIRATILRLGNGAEVIVPNGKLIAERLTNWTLTSRLRRIDVVITSTMDNDPELIRDLLLEQALATPDVVARPSPQALLNKLGPDSLEFSVQAWTEEAQRWPRVQSALLLGINARLKERGISLKAGPAVASPVIAAADLPAAADAPGGAPGGAPVPAPTSAAPVAGPASGGPATASGAAGATAPHRKPAEPVAVAG